MCFAILPFIATITGNLLTVIAILTAKHMHTTTNILIGSMAMAEFMTMLTTPIIHVSYYI